MTLKIICKTLPTICKTLGAICKTLRLACSLSSQNLIRRITASGQALSLLHEDSVLRIAHGSVDHFARKSISQPDYIDITKAGGGRIYPVKF